MVCRQSSLIRPAVRFMRMFAKRTNQFLPKVAQVPDDRRQLLQHIVHLVHRVVAREREADRAVDRDERHAHGADDVRGIERSGSARRTGRDADALVREMVGDRLALDVLEADVECVGEAVRRIAVHAHVRAGGEDAGLKLVAHRRELLRLRVHVRGRQLARLGESRDVRYVLRARAPSALLMPAEHERLQFRAAPHEEDAHALRRVELVPRDGEQVHRHLLHVQRRLAGRLHGVRMDDGAAFLGDLGDLADREHGPRLVVRPHRRDERALRAFQLGAQALQVNLPNAVDGQFHDLVPLRLQAAGGLEDGRMLHRRRDDLQFLAVPVRDAAQGRVVALRGAGREQHLVRLAVEERRHLFPRLRHVCGHLPAKRVHGGRIAVQFAKERHHGLPHLRGNLRRRVVVEIDRLAHL